MNCRKETCQSELAMQALGHGQKSRTSYSVRLTFGPFDDALHR